MKKTVSITNDISQLKRIPPFLEDVFKECPLSGKDRMLVRSGLDEALTNCVNYAYPDSEGEILLEAQILDDCLVFTLTDSGSEFNPLEYRKVEKEDIQIGGLGIQMMKNHFDSLEYERKEGQNILKLKKKMI